VTGIEIRALAAHADLDAAVHLQHEVWGYAPGDSVPLQMFIIAAGTGGQVLGAFEAGRMGGFLLAFPALKPDGTPYLYSHMLGVRPECRNRHIGRALKLEQRRDALARGIALVEWTFDPLELKNAHFNIEVLGAIARRYLPNHWGSTSSPLHGSLPTDRLVAEWWLRENPGQYTHSPISARPSAAAQPHRNRGMSVPSRVVVPADISEARRMQAAIGAQFLDCFGRGLAVVGFERGSYLLAKWPSE
jgi:predicted GNAT superfamily acetyltransferase